MFRYDKAQDKGACFEPRDVQVGVQQDGSGDPLSFLAAGERIVVNGGVKQ